MPAARLLLYTGKGGVGKTTTAAATALRAAQLGLRTLVVSADAAHSLGDVLEQGLGPEPEPVRVPADPDIGAAAELRAMEVDGRVEMGRHWGRIRDYLVQLFRYQGIEEVVAEELALLPGAEELAALLAVEAHCESGAYDLVVVDCAPTDSTLRLVTLPEVAHGALRWLLRVQQGLSAVVRPLARGVIPVPLPDPGVFRDAERLLYRKLRALRRRLQARSTHVRLVVTPERMVIDEARRAFTDLCLFGIPCDAVVLNRMLPEEARNEPLLRDWVALQDERREEIGRDFDPLALLTAPLQDDEVTGPERLALHGARLFQARPPQAVMCAAPRPRFERCGEGYRARLPLPGARQEDLEVSVAEEALLVRSGERRRSILLPRRMWALDLVGARLAGGELVVDFGQAGAPG